MAEYPPGWNDPPPLSFSPCSLSSGKRNLLNKRVPFPLNQSTCSPQPSTEKYELPDSSSSVPSQTIASSTQDTIIPKESTESLNCSVPEEEILPFITKTFERILAENFDKHEKKRIDEINQRIKIMKDSWESKISPPVKQKMFALAQELSNGNADAALKIQCILMVDYLREVKQWMVGVKHIIEMERQNVSSPEVTSTDPN